MNRSIIAALSGLIFGFGLSLSGMTNRDRVLGFLDVTGNWDASLVFVMGGAVCVTLISFRFILKRTAPILDTRFHLPSRKDIDARLVLGSALFGVGWGLAGYCPGPVIAALHSFALNPLMFFFCFIAGSLLGQVVTNSMERSKA